jgi:hypothetical protein
MTHKELIRKAKEYIESQQDDYNEETWCTDRSLAKSEMMGFFAFMGIKTDELVAIHINP